VKKIISTSLLLLANIIMLAHTIVPHHHHNGFVVALLERNIKERSQDHHHASSDHNHTPSDHHQAPSTHNHESNSETEKCALNEVYTRSDNSPKFECYENCDYKTSKTFVSPRGIDKFSLVNEGGLPFRQKPYIESYYSKFSSGSIGLRAPPVC
jgi:hypothetical protein